MSLTHIMEGNQLSFKPTDLMLISFKKIFTETSTIVFDPIAGYCDMARWTHKLTITFAMPLVGAR